jgi:hypothetical protein
MEDEHPVSHELHGKMSTFGGPNDTGVSPSEGLALVQPAHLADLADYFLPTQPPGTTGLARRLDPQSHYIACRWNYSVTPKAFLRASFVTVRNPRTGVEAQTKPVDWGPAASTGRVADLSPGLATHLGLETDDVVDIIVPHPT